MASKPPGCGSSLHSVEPVVSQIHEIGVLERMGYA
jgi:hypothetical protein